MLFKKRDTVETQPSKFYDLNGCNVIIGLTGPFCSGVSTIANFIEKKYNFKKVSLAEYVRERRTQIDIEHLKNQKRYCGFFNEKSERQILQSVGNYICFNKGNIQCDLIAEKALPKIDIHKHSYVVTGFRRLSEIKLFKEVFKNRFYLIGIDSEYDDRIQRYKADQLLRLKKVKAQKGYTFDEEMFYFEDQRDKKEYTLIYGQDVQNAYYFADYYVHNEQNPVIKYNRAYDKVQNRYDLLLTNNTKGFIDRLLVVGISRISKPDPTMTEFGMSCAFLSTVIARCLQRYVGAALFKMSDSYRNPELLSIGYNAPPSGEEECKEICNRKKVHAEQVVKCSGCGNIIGGATVCLFCGRVERDKQENPKDLENCKSIHAEHRAINGAQRSLTNGTNAILYTTTFPCNLCATAIAENRHIKEVVYLEPYPQRSAKEILKRAGVKQTSYSGISPRSIYRIVLGPDFERLPT